MPNEISIGSVAAASGASENAMEPDTRPPTPPSRGPPTATAAPLPNPQLRLDPALGLVVIEFRDANGIITTSIPTQRQLHAYRIWEQNRSPPTGPHQAQQREATQSAASRKPSGDGA